MSKVASINKWINECKSRNKSFLHKKLHICGNTNTLGGETLFPHVSLEGKLDLVSHFQRID